jgi:hypothetical protein
LEEDELKPGPDTDKEIKKVSRLNYHFMIPKHFYAIKELK